MLYVENFSVDNSIHTGQKNPQHTVNKNSHGICGTPLVY